MHDLSERQRETLALAAQGLTHKAIARQLDISVPTAKKHLCLAREALAAWNTTHAVAIAIAGRLIPFCPKGCPPASCTCNTPSIPPSY